MNITLVKRNLDSAPIFCADIFKVISHFFGKFSKVNHFLGSTSFSEFVFLWMDGWTDGRVDGRMDGRVDGRMNGRTDGWMNGWTDKPEHQDMFFKLFPLEV